MTDANYLRINSGDYPDLVIPLHHNANQVINELNRRQ